MQVKSEQHALFERFKEERPPATALGVERIQVGTTAAGFAKRTASQHINVAPTTTKNQRSPGRESKNTENNLNGKNRGFALSNEIKGEMDDFVDDGNCDGCAPTVVELPTVGVQESEAVTRSRRREGNEGGAFVAAPWGSEKESSRGGDSADPARYVPSRR
jgi:hypothetical protein